jgi:microcystin-dependent protein
MAEPFLSEIRLFSFNFAPNGWAATDGQLLPINQNQALYSLLGHVYGGNGQTNFGLPDLRGRVAIHFDSNFPLGHSSGEVVHTLSISEIPLHQHTLNATTQTTSMQSSPAGATLAGAQIWNSSTSNQTSLNPASIANTGGSQPHDNMQPSNTGMFCIALQGIFPSQN